VQSKIRRMRVVAFPFGPKGWAQQSQEVTLQWFAFRALSTTMSTDSDGTFICITSSTSLDGKNKTDLATSATRSFTFNCFNCRTHTHTNVGMNQHFSKKRITFIATSYLVWKSDCWSGFDQFPPSKCARIYASNAPLCQWHVICGRCLHLSNRMP